MPASYLHIGGLVSIVAGLSLYQAGCLRSSAVQCTVLDRSDEVHTISTDHNAQIVCLRYLVCYDGYTAGSVNAVARKGVMPMPTVAVLPGLGRRGVRGVLWERTLMRASNSGSPTMVRSTTTKLLDVA